MKKQYSSMIGGLIAGCFALTALFVPCMVHAQAQSHMKMSVGHDMQVASGSDAMSCCQMNREHREPVVLQSTSESSTAKSASSGILVNTLQTQVSGGLHISSDFPIVYRSRDPSYLMVFRC